MYGRTYPPPGGAEEVMLEVIPRVNPAYPDQPQPFGARGASACYGRDPADGRPALRLFLCPALLGPPTLATVPYLLCHELVCHAFQGAEHRSDDPFGEGWMDRVALALHDAWSDDLFPTAPQLAREEANALALAVRTRAVGLIEPHMTTRAARRQGWDAAGNVQRWLTRWEGGQSQSPSSFELLSVEMNSAVHSVAERKEFVANVLLEAQNDDIVSLPRLAEALRGWMTDTTTPPQQLAEAVLRSFS